MDASNGELVVYDYADPSAPRVHDFVIGTEYARWLEDQTKLVYVHNFAPLTLRYSSFDNLVPSPATIVDTGELEHVLSLERSAWPVATLSNVATP